MGIDTADKRAVARIDRHRRLHVRAQGQRIDIDRQNIVRGALHRERIDVAGARAIRSVADRAIGLDQAGPSGPAGICRRRQPRPIGQKNRAVVLGLGDFRNQAGAGRLVADSLRHVRLLFFFFACSDGEGTRRRANALAARATILRDRKRGPRRIQLFSSAGTSVCSEWSGRNLEPPTSMVIRQSDDCLADVCSQTLRQMARVWRTSSDRSHVTHGKCMIDWRLSAAARAVCCKNHRHRG